MEVKEQPSAVKLNGTDKEVKNIKTQHSDETDVIIIPSKMTKLQAARELELQHQEEEKIVVKLKVLENWNDKDGLVAIMRTIRKVFGWVNGQTVYGFFGPNHPKEIKIKTDVNAWEDCFIGQFLIAAWENCKANVGQSNGGQAFVQFEVKKKFSARVDAFFLAVEEELKTNSIYKGKCLTWNEQTGFDFIENKGTDEIILNKNEQLVLDYFVMKPITSSEYSKRGILFAGPYGTGKTETALKIGREATKAGQTFIYCKSRNLQILLNVAKQYQPSVIFIEDLDEITSGERDSKINDLLNTIDGIETKGQKLTLIMTTNHKEKINQAFRRPGRIDVVMNFDLPDAETIAVMFKKFLKNGKGAEHLDYVTLAGKTPKIQGAVVKEIANRALLLADGETITNEHVETSIEAAKMQIDFMQEKIEKKETTIENIIESTVTNVVETRVEKVLNENKKVKDIHRNFV